MKLKQITNKSQITKQEPDTYILDSDEKTARSIITSLKQKNFKGKIAVLGRDNLFNRRALETLNIDFFISPERELKPGQRKDTLKQRDSGLNHILGKIAAKNKIAIVIDFPSIQKIQNKKQKALRLARVIQNIKICRKAKCLIKIWDLTNKSNSRILKSFGFSLGMSSQQVKSAV